MMADLNGSADIVEYMWKAVRDRSQKAGRTVQQTIEDIRALLNSVKTVPADLEVVNELRAAEELENAEKKRVEDERMKNEARQQAEASQKMAEAVQKMALAERQRAEAERTLALKAKQEEEEAERKQREEIIKQAESSVKVPKYLIDASERAKKFALAKAKADAEAKASQKAKDVKKAETITRKFDEALGAAAQKAKTFLAPKEETRAQTLQRVYDALITSITNWEFNIFLYNLKSLREEWRVNRVPQLTDKQITELLKICIYRQPFSLQALLDYIEEYKGLEDGLDLLSKTIGIGTEYEDVIWNRHQGQLKGQLNDEYIKLYLIYLERREASSIAEIAAKTAAQQEAAGVAARAALAALASGPRPSVPSGPRPSVPSGPRPSQRSLIRYKGKILIPREGETTKDAKERFDREQKVARIKAAQMERAARDAKVDLMEAARKAEDDARMGAEPDFEGAAELELSKEVMEYIRDYAQNTFDRIERERVDVLNYPELVGHLRNIVNSRNKASAFENFRLANALIDKILPKKLVLTMPELVGLKTRAKQEFMYKARGGEHVDAYQKFITDIDRAETVEEVRALMENMGAVVKDVNSRAYDGFDL